ncbi:MAG TPA: OmpA family protein [Xanthobacteraceae bacterium]|nr:OmpA family protein [Xanthobacteraceae bacterium]
MSRPAKWWWGLIPLFLLWIVSNSWLGNSINADLTARALKSATAGVYNPAVSVAGRDVTLNGVVFSDAQNAAQLDAIAKEWGVRKVVSALALPPVASPFNWKLERRGNDLVVTGAVPNPDSRKAILATLEAAFPGTKTQDASTFARGGASSFVEAVNFTVKQIASLERPTITFADGKVSVTGRAASIEAREQILNALKSFPQGFTLASAEIEAPEPYGFSARKTDDTLTLTGSVPDEALRKQILDAARRLFGGYRVADQLTLTPNAPAGFQQAVLAGLAGLSRLADGALTIRGNKGELSGNAFYAEALNAIRASLARSLPGGFTVDLKAGVQATGPAIDAAACQTSVNTLLGKTTILFETGAANISSDSAGLLDRIAGTFARCAEAKVEIAGHTDSTGDASANLALSQQRAEAVLNYLTRAGLAAGNFVAKGYGQERPVASNETEDGRARNRRTEFVVQ